MNPWKALNIEPTNDKKLIKKAYAVLIKQYKPDEYPEEFKEIQEAYKHALAIRQWQIEEEQANKNTEIVTEKPILSDFKLSDDNKNEKHVESEFQYENLENNDFTLSPAQVDGSDLEFQYQQVQQSTNNFSLSEVKVDKEQLDFQQKQQNIIDELYNQIQVMAFAPLVDKNKRDNWKFVEDFYKIDDILLKSDVAINVFNKVAEYNLFQLQANGTLLINKEVVKYFNKIFDWSHEWKTYQSIFPDNRYIVNFQFIDATENKEAKKNSLLFLRIASFGVDVLLIYFIAFLISLFLLSLEVKIFDTSFFPILGFVLMLFLRFIIELKSKYKRTIGKKINHLIIIDSYGNYCTTKESIIRHLIVGVQILLMAFAPMIINSDDKDDIFLMFFYGIIFINITTYIFTKKLIHDYISGTQVAKQVVIKT